MAQQLRHILWLGLKELLSLAHDPVLFIFILYALTLQVIVAAVGLTLEVKNAALAIVDEDRSQLSGRLQQAFHKPYFRRPVLISTPEIDGALDRGTYTFIIRIPPHFQADVVAGRRPQLQINVDATAVSQAYVGAAYIRRIVGNELTRYSHWPDTTANPVIEARTRVKYNPNRDETWFGGVVELAIMITLLSILLPGAALLREREHGTVEHLLAMPLTPAEIMLSKVWANGVVIVGGGVLSIFLVIRVALGVPIQGSIWLFAVGTLVFQFSTAGLGMLLATLTRTIQQMTLISFLVVMVILEISGVWTPLEGMPAVMRWLAQLSPLKHYVDFATAIVFRGAGLGVLWPQLAIMAAIGSALFLCAVVRFRAHFGAARA